MDESHKQNVEWNKVDIKEDMRYNFISIKFKAGKTNLTIVVHIVLTLGWSNDWERAQRSTSFVLVMISFLVWKHIVKVH